MLSKKDIFNFLKFNKVEIIGSYQDPQIKYPADIDLQEVIETDLPPNDILKIFQRKFKFAQSNPGHSYRGSS